MNNLKRYSVGFWYEEKGTATVQAETPEEAERLVKLHLDEEGLANIDYVCNDREIGTSWAEVMK